MHPQTIEIYGNYILLSIPKSSFAVLTQKDGELVCIINGKFKDVFPKYWRLTGRSYAVQ